MTYTKKDIRCLNLRVWVLTAVICLGFASHGPANYKEQLHY